MLKLVGVASTCQTNQPKRIGTGYLATGRGNRLSYGAFAVGSGDMDPVSLTSSQ